MTGDRVQRTRAHILEAFLRLAVEKGIDSTPTRLVAVEVLQRALQQAAPQLRPEVDRQAAVISLQGLLLVTVLWTFHGWMQLEPQEWDGLLEAATRTLVRAPD